MSPVLLCLRSGAARTLIVLALAMLAADCTSPHEPRDSTLAIELRWVKGYPEETHAKVATGLRWGLSFLGAKLPANGSAISWRGDTITLDIDAAEVAEPTKPAWRRLLAVLKESEEYRRTGGIDIGRFMMLTLCSSHQYFALTGAREKLADFRDAHRFDPEPVAIVQSVIAHGNRLIEIGLGEGLRNVAFMAYEGTGSLVDNTFSKSEIETIDFMDNGQLRFGLYDLDGKLKAAGTPALTAAGKPSKCLWCHEIRLQPPFKNVTDLAGFHSTAEFRAILAERMQIVEEARRHLDSQIDFSRTQDHTFAELLYLSFAEPSADRLAREWNLPVERVRDLLRGLRTHRQAEFQWLGEQLYSRAEVDKFAPFGAIAVPSDVREASAYEPDLLSSPGAPGAP